MEVSTSQELHNVAAAEGGDAGVTDVGVASLAEISRLFRRSHRPLLELLPPPLPPPLGVWHRPGLEVRHTEPLLSVDTKSLHDRHRPPLVVQTRVMSPHHAGLHLDLFSSSSECCTACLMRDVGRDIFWIERIQMLSFIKPQCQSPRLLYLECSGLRLVAV